MKHEWTDEQTREMINKAIDIAVKAHYPDHRKGSEWEPYITHPMEVMCIMNNMGLIKTDPNLVIAGILHDVAEDTSYTLEKIREIFGDDVSELVESHTEDKNKTWEERKQKLFDELKTADDRVKTLIMADALANLRSLYRDVRLIGDELWSRFNAPKEKQYWYYSNAIEAVRVLETYSYSKPIFDEMIRLFNKVFAK